MSPLCTILCVLICFLNKISLSQWTVIWFEDGASNDQIQGVHEWEVDGTVRFGTVYDTYGYCDGYSVDMYFGQMKRGTDISGYTDIRINYTVFTAGRCEIYYSFDKDILSDATLLASDAGLMSGYINSVKLPSNIGVNMLYLWFKADETYTCQWDNIYLEGISPPTNNPTRAPTIDPTKSPTLYPTKSPTLYPTKRPTLYPTKSPTLYPTKRPTLYPTKSPTLLPTKSPTTPPTTDPTTDPTTSPTKYPTTDPILTQTLTVDIARDISTSHSTPQSTLTPTDPSNTDDSWFNIRIPHINIVIIIFCCSIFFICCMGICICMICCFYTQKPSKKPPRKPQKEEDVAMEFGKLNTTNAATGIVTAGAGVASWLRFHVGLPQYYPLFIDNGYESLNAIKAMDSRSDLGDMGITRKGHQILIWSEIQKLQRVDPAEMQPGVGYDFGEQNGLIVGEIPRIPLPKDQENVIKETEQSEGQRWSVMSDDSVYDTGKTSQYYS